jgi:hypothetical protein
MTHGIIDDDHGNVRAILTVPTRVVRAGILGQRLSR